MDGRNDAVPCGIIAAGQHQRPNGQDRSAAGHSPARPGPFYPHRHRRFCSPSRYGRSRRPNCAGAAGNSGFIPTKVPKVPQDFRHCVDVTGFSAFWLPPNAGAVQAAGFGGRIPMESFSFSSEKSYSPSMLTCAHDMGERAAMARRRLCHSSIRQCPTALSMIHRTHLSRSHRCKSGFRSSSAGLPAPMHPKVLPDTGEAIVAEAECLGLTQSQLIERMWQTYRYGTAS